MQVYWNYFRSGGGYVSFLLFVVCCFVTQILFTGTDYWVTLWTNAEELRHRRAASASNTSLNSNSSFNDMSADFFNSTTSNASDDHPNITEVEWIDNIDTMTGVYVYTAMISGLFAFSMLRTIHFFLMCMTSSINLHNDMFQSVIRTPLDFFDKNPVGNDLEMDPIGIVHNFSFIHLFIHYQDAF